MNNDSYERGRESDINQRPIAKRFATSGVTPNRSDGTSGPSNRASDAAEAIAFGPLPHDYALLTGARRALLIGPVALTQQVLASLSPQFAGPVLSMKVRDQFSLPPTRDVGTLILNDVDRLTKHDQVALLNWLDASTCPNVISTSLKPVLPDVNVGVFLGALYYRLNIVYVDLTQATPQSVRFD